MKHIPKYHIATVCVSALNDFATGMCQALRDIGYQATYTPYLLDDESVNIVLDAPIITDWSNIPTNSIIFNLEQLNSDSKLITPDYLRILSSYEGWDYSTRNIEWMRGKGLTNIRHVPIGYTPSLTRIKSAPKQDIDVLFYGILSQRRKNIINQFQDKGFNVIVAESAYEDGLDNLISRSKIILNIHCYEAKVFEIIRCSYLLANRKAVVSEVDRDTEIDPYLRNAIFGAPADKLVEACTYLLHNEQQRIALENRGYDIFTAMPQSAFIPLPPILTTPPLPMRSIEHHANAALLHGNKAS